MKVLIGCEFSGIVRDAFLAAGHDAVSCDLLPTESPGPHIEGDVLTAVQDFEWDLVILHPPCTALCVAGNGTYAGSGDRAHAIVWTRALFANAVLRARHVAMENPVGALSSGWRPPDQYVQPWQFGHGETKKTGFWLHALPHLEPTEVVAGREPRVHHESPGPDRWKNRSRTYHGIAAAMADQWGRAAA